MAKITASRTIRAPREEVFAVTADLEDHADVVPRVTDVEFLTEQRWGAGTRARQTNGAGRRRSTAELEITESEHPGRFRLVADERGSTWDRTLTYLTTRDGTELHLQVDVRPRTVLARLTNRFRLGSATRDLEDELDAVVAHFEPR